MDALTLNVGHLCYVENYSQNMHICSLISIIGLRGAKLANLKSPPRPHYGNHQDHPDLVGEVFWTKILGISMNRRVPRTDPCGIPDVTSRHDDDWPSITTLCCLFER
jgi:hypothetical protein